jgi:hypothetical protein
MAQVPFSGVPQVAPGGVPLSRYHADVSAETFGGTVGTALQGLGGQLKSTGSELFERGIAMQTLYNHSEASDADAQYMETAGKLHAEYSSLSGKAAVDALPKYFDDLKTTRQQISKGLSNEMSQKLFESSSNGTLGRSIFNGAGHAASENKKYALGASTARISAIGNNVLSTPEDERSFNTGLETTEREVRAQGALQGMAPEAIDEAVSLQKSKLWGERIKGLAKQEPLKAGKMLEDGIKRGDIRGEDISKLTSLVDQQRRTVGSRMISNQVMKGVGTSYGSGIVPIEQAQEAIGQFESGGRYNLVGVETKHGRALGKYQVMEEFLPEFLKSAGMPAMTRDEFLKSPSAQDQLFASRFGQYMKETGSFNDAASKWFSGKTMAEAGDRKDALGTTVPGYVSNVNAILARNAPLAQKVAEGTKLATAAAPDDPLFPEFVEQRIKTDHDRNVAVRRDTEFQNRQVIEDGLMGGKDGKLPTTVEELTNTNEKAQAWADLLPSNQRRYMKVLEHNIKGDIAPSPETLRKTQSFKAMSQDNPADFLDQSFADMTDLPISDRRSLMSLQMQVKKGAGQDPRLNRALTILGPDMQAAGIDKKDKETYYQFTGALMDQLQQFAEENKRPPKADETKLMGARLLQQQRSPGFFGTVFGTKTPVFQLPVPTDEAEKIKAEPAWAKLGIMPTDAQIQRIYTRKLFQDLYGGATGSPGGMPSPPVSK